MFVFFMIGLNIIMMGLNVFGIFGLFGLFWIIYVKDKKLIFNRIII